MLTRWKVQYWAGKLNLLGCWARTGPKKCEALTWAWSWQSASKDDQRVRSAWGRGGGVLRVSGPPGRKAGMERFGPQARIQRRGLVRVGSSRASTSTPTPLCFFGALDHRMPLQVFQGQCTTSSLLGMHVLASTTCLPTHLEAEVEILDGVLVPVGPLADPPQQVQPGGSIGDQVRLIERQKSHNEGYV